MNSNLVIVLTVRMGSERLPGKAMLEVAGKPLLYWIVRRLQTIGNVVVHPTDRPEDDIIASYVTAMGVPVHRGPTGKVIDGMNEAMLRYYPNAEFIMRGLGDCPFMTKEIIDRMCLSMHKYGGDFTIFALPPWIMPVYGSRESPYSRAGWDRLVKESQERCHVDSYLHQNRERFNILYHEPPPNIYFRPYRLEIDYQQDMAMLRELAKHISMSAVTTEIIKTLDARSEIADINRACVEQTGPTRYSRKHQREWMAVMRGKAVVSWDNYVWNPPSEKAEPIFCNGGKCLIGYGDDGVLYRINGDIIKGDAVVQCGCGVGKRWRGRTG